MKCEVQMVWLVLMKVGQYLFIDVIWVQFGNIGFKSMILWLLKEIEDEQVGGGVVVVYVSISEQLQVLVVNFVVWLELEFQECFDVLKEGYVVEVKCFIEVCDEVVVEFLVLLCLVESCQVEVVEVKVVCQCVEGEFDVFWIEYVQIIGQFLIQVVVLQEQFEVVKVYVVELGKQYEYVYQVFEYFCIVLKEQCDCEVCQYEQQI